MQRLQYENKFFIMNKKRKLQSFSCRLEELHFSRTWHVNGHFFCDSVLVGYFYIQSFLYIFGMIDFDVNRWYLFVLSTQVNVVHANLWICVGFSVAIQTWSHNWKRNNKDDAYNFIVIIVKTFAIRNIVEEYSFSFWLYRFFISMLFRICRASSEEMIIHDMTNMFSRQTNIRCYDFSPLAW